MAKGFNVTFSKEGKEESEVTVTVTLFNYARYILETLESLHRQELEVFDLIIVDDHSQDHGPAITQRWLERNSDRFNTIKLVRHVKNSGLAAARNTAFSLAETAFVFVMDADNQLYPRCLKRLHVALRSTPAALAYPVLERFGDDQGLMGSDAWSSEKLALGNYIDAMALLRKSAWKSVDGYSAMSVSGWEDYELWCKFVEAGFFGRQVPEILARYRVHASSLLRTTTNPRVDTLKEEMKRLHPWLNLDADPELQDLPLPLRRVAHVVREAVKRYSWRYPCVHQFLRTHWRLARRVLTSPTLTRIFRR